MPGMVIDCFPVLVWVQSHSLQCESGSGVGENVTYKWPLSVISSWDEHRDNTKVITVISPTEGRTA